MTGPSPLRLTIVRERLEDRELWTFSEARSDGVEVRAVSLERGGPYAATGLDLPVTQAQTRAGLLRLHRLPGVVGRRAERAVDGGRALRLDELLAGTDVVNVSETHLRSSRQVVEAARRIGYRVLVTAYENIPFRYEDEPGAARNKDAVRAGADHFVAVTPEAREALMVEGVAADRITLQPYGIDPDRFAGGTRNRALRASWGADDDTVVVLYLGRFLREKGLVELVRAFHGLPGPRVRLVLVGGGDEVGRLRRACATLGEDRVVIVPWVDPSAVPVVLASADVFAMPSLPTPYWQEQLGFAMLEAMAAGLAVVATTSGSFPFVVGDAGILVPPYDHDALHAALAAVCTDAEQRARLGEQARARAVTHFGTAAAGRTYRELVRALAGR